jgi:hypothetical protein
VAKAPEQLIVLHVHKKRLKVDSYAEQLAQKSPAELRLLSRFKGRHGLK